MAALWRAGGRHDSLALDPVLAELAAAVLIELGLAVRDGATLVLQPGAQKRDPGESSTYAAHAARLAECRAHLGSLASLEPSLELVS